MGFLAAFMPFGMTYGLGPARDLSSGRMVFAVTLQPGEQAGGPQEGPEPGAEDFDGWFARGINFAQLGFPDRAVEAFELAEVIQKLTGAVIQNLENPRNEADRNDLHVDNRSLIGLGLQPITLESGKLYRVVLYSPNSTLEDGYFVYGHEFMLDKTLGFGSTIHHLTASFDGLKSWIEWYDADAVFKFINTN